MIKSRYNKSSVTTITLLWINFYRLKVILKEFKPYREKLQQCNQVTEPSISSSSSSPSGQSGVPSQNRSTDKHDPLLHWKRFDWHLLLHSSLMSPQSSYRSQIFELIIQRLFAQRKEKGHPRKHSSSRLTHCSSPSHKYLLIATKISSWKLNDFFSTIFGAFVSFVFRYNLVSKLLQAF